MSGTRHAAFLLAKRALFPGTDVALRERIRFVRHFRPGPVSTLDVGCGNGAFTIAAYRLGNRALGIDHDEGNIARAREFAGYLGLDPARIRFEQQDAYGLDADGGRFDQIVAFEILEHLADDRGMVARLAELLAPGGVVHLSTPFLHRRPFYSEVLTDVENGAHLRLGYTHEQLEELLEAAGLTPVLRDAAVGRLGLAALEIVNRVERVAGRAGAVAALLATRPLALADRVAGGDFRLIVYVQGRKRG